MISINFSSSSSEDSDDIPEIPKPAQKSRGKPPKRAKPKRSTSNLDESDDIPILQSSKQQGKQQDNTKQDKSSDNEDLPKMNPGPKRGRGKQKNAAAVRKSANNENMNEIQPIDDEEKQIPENKENKKRGPPRRRSVKKSSPLQNNSSSDDDLPIIKTNKAIIKKSPAHPPQTNTSINNDYSDDVEEKPVPNRGKRYRGRGARRGNKQPRKSASSTNESDDIELPVISRAPIKQAKIIDNKPKQDEVVKSSSSDESSYDEDSGEKNKKKVFSIHDSQAKAKANESASQSSAKPNDNFELTEGVNENFELHRKNSMDMKVERDAIVKTFQIERKSRTKINGKIYHFQMMDQGKILFTAKSKGRHPTRIIPIKIGADDPHIKGQNDYVLVPESYTDFTLKKSNENGQIMMRFMVKDDKISLIIPRFTEVFVYNEHGEEIHHIHSKRPSMSARGYWVLNFHNKFTISSEKNAVFVREDNADKDVCLIRKISRDTIEYDAITEFDPIIAFGIALGSLVAKFSKK